MAAFIESPIPTKEVREPDDFLSDDSTIRNYEWRFLKHTFKSSEFDLKKFEVSPSVCD